MHYLYKLDSNSIHAVKLTLVKSTSMELLCSIFSFQQWSYKRSQNSKLIIVQHVLSAWPDGIIWPVSTAMKPSKMPSDSESQGVDIQNRHFDCS